MKKTGIVSIIIILLLSMAACQAQEVVSEEVDVQPQEITTGPFGEVDLIFIYQGVGYPISSDAVLLVEAFGTDYEEIGAPSCSFVGEDKQFIFSFATIYTYPMDDVDLINEIYIYDGDFVTNRGISLGDTKEDVVAAYGEGGVDQSDSYVYVLSGDIADTASPKLYFELTDGIVTGISYYGANGVVL